MSTSADGARSLLSPRVSLSPGARRIVRAILRGDVPGWNGKCATEREAAELSAAGLPIQIECNHMDPRHCYPLRRDGSFQARARELGF